ncbi:carbon-nitrogen hydrolase family protein [Vibrio sp. ZSDZ65]|uniref:Carbon-nitrogen hydrolase family protein n=1 Tax=Vibrio qingdaonensis TaxID=2829491 RepID=A0A9X3CTF8_9VIBR|nr:carbon-nitrogen hydrolase family protein [Vibrio qingdaonensis]MCW8349289.1 carbon-nitrogen hydrolase family protein [Vibrio qingdaonensis]
MASSINISLAQVPVFKEDIVANIEQHLVAIEASVSLGADLVVFPELSLTGYELKSLAKLALGKLPSNFSHLSQAASKHNISVIVGCPLVSGDSLKPSIGAVVCHPDGNVEFYDKQHLHDGEHEYCSSGSEDYFLTIKGYKVALAICADFSCPEHAERAKRLGADVYLVSALISTAGYSTDAKLLSDIAATNGMPVLLSNHISPTGGWSVCGNNAVWNNEGKLVTSSESVEECVVLCTITFSTVGASKHNKALNLTANAWHFQFG